MRVSINFLSNFMLAQTTAYFTSVCIKDHEQFSLCAWKCAPTCVNIKMLSAHATCPLPWACHVGCRCAPGYLRDEWSKKCVMVTDCPDYDTCPPGEVMGYFMQCVTPMTSSHFNQSHWDYYPDPREGRQHNTTDEEDVDLDHRSLSSEDDDY
ncbi:uncharacterized protein LOC125228228 [Leguminivora glycinivorella]|uniref:uncharacterized protein LOC125228228 n=1 Tax=Leguminivora glycinivorella TaxID=1035111 RepID=UPI00200EF940|nr:uncharacterized protein LOC125228228 [Leguminivora glycinivorella]